MAYFTLAKQEGKLNSWEQEEGYTTLAEAKDNLQFLRDDNVSDKHTKFLIVKHANGNYQNIVQDYKTLNTLAIHGQLGKGFVDMTMNK